MTQAKYPKRQLGELIKIKHGYAFKSEYFSDSGKFVLLTPGNFYETGGFRERPGKDRFFVGEFPEEYLLEFNDLIVAMTEQGEGLLGSTAFIPSSGVYLHNQRLGLITIKDPAEACCKYLFYLFNTRSVRQQIRGSSSGTKVRHTSPERIYKVQAEIPLLPVQRKIAAILSAYDDLIENCDRRITLLEKMAEEIYREWFVRLRFPGHEQTTFHKGIPEGWEVQEMGKVARITMGLSPKGDTYNEYGEGVPLINGPVEFSERFTKAIKWTTAPTKVCNTGDLIVCVRGSTTGRNVKSDGEYCLGRGVCAISSEQQSFVDQMFAQQLPVLLGMTSGSTFPSWTGPQLKSHQVLVPSLALRSRFDRIARPMSNSIQVLARQSEMLACIRDRLLTRLISGKLSVEDLDIQFPPSMIEDLPHEQ
jgi:type I restriction enzyme S subunit